ncbi:hypothetical protein R69658_02641 [Paraburkholderia aspalathi]|uniref:Secreted protein n=1 Tax=Paraburkholderia aspalathi TaxID=1324617 RepID=A0ABM8RF94_9BURK|nr:hypothetical protein R69658_02641 [Paraburkholderia aspalathi]
MRGFGRCGRGFLCLLGAFVSVLGALAFPCFVSGLLALPLCGAAPTSLCRLQREVGKRKQLKPLMLSGHRGLLRVVVHLESGFVPLHTPVTRASYFRRRCARRRAVHKTTRYVLTSTPRHRAVARPCTAAAVTVIEGHRRRGFSGECRSASPRRSRRLPADLNRSLWFPMQTRPRRTQCGVGADEPLVTNAECARTRIPDAPLPMADHGPHLELAV